jgi:mannose-6-phosphate isomerase
MRFGLCRLENTIQEYAWGSHTAIPDLLGRPSPSARPQAEMWMGAHPGAPSRVLIQGTAEPLDRLIAQYPAVILGERCARRYGGRLPFLLKILAAEQPLSIQAHPTRQQAERGFARENARGLAPDSPNRSYRDDNHKPEILAPLVPTWALHGFRAPSEAVSLMRQVDVAELTTLARLLEQGGLRDFFVAIFGLSPHSREALVARVAEAVPVRIGGPVAEWTTRLFARHPGDPGVLAPLFLNLVQVPPGSAVYLGPGELHAYLQGLGVELMANSDNVLRGGLTSKRVDLPELLETLLFRPTVPVPLTPRALPTGEEVFDTPAEEFVLSRVRLEGGRAFTRKTPPSDRSAEILVVTEGSAVATARPGKPLVLPRGASCLVPAEVAEYTLAGTATVFRATVGAETAG